MRKQIGAASQEEQDKIKKVIIMIDDEVKTLRRRMYILLGLTIVNVAFAIYIMLQ